MCLPECEKWPEYFMVNDCHPENLIACKLDGAAWLEQSDFSGKSNVQMAPQNLKRFGNTREFCAVPGIEHPSDFLFVNS